MRLCCRRCWVRSQRWVFAALTWVISTTALQGSLWEQTPAILQTDGEWQTAASDWRWMGPKILGFGPVFHVQVNGPYVLRLPKYFSLNPTECFRYSILYTVYCILYSSSIANSFCYISSKLTLNYNYNSTQYCTETNKKKFFPVKISKHSWIQLYLLKK